MMQPLTDDELRAFARELGRKLSSADTAQRDALVREEAARVFERRANRIPRGCDARGRYPQAAEACTEIGADDDDPLRAARGVVWGVIAGLLLWFGIALLVVTLAGL